MKNMVIFKDKINIVNMEENILYVIKRELKYYILKLFF